MQLFNFIFTYFTIAVNLYSLIKVYSLISDNKLIFNLKNFITFNITSIVVVIINYYFVFYSRIFLTIFCTFIAYKIIFNEKLYLVLYKIVVIYIILMICDFVVSIVFLFFPINSVTDIGNITLIKGISTLLVSILLLLVFLSKKLQRVIDKFQTFLMVRSNLLFLAFTILLFIIYISLTYLNAIEFNSKLFIICLFLLITFLIFWIILLVQYFRNKNVEKEQESLLKLMNEYEKMLEKDRINRHEMLNNLVVLKSAYKGSKKEYEEMLDDIINEYQYKKSGVYSKLYNLPSGIKGVIYYRLINTQISDLNFNLFISDKSKKLLENLNTKDYYKICKIMGILIDNAIEASEKTEDKLILIDIYVENDNLIFYIENTYEKTLDINSFCEKGVSSKGENRGYGLYIVNKMVKQNKFLEFNQYAKQNKVISILKMKDC